MEDRCVTHVRRNADGDIRALCHPGEPWSPREAEDAIHEIEHKRNRYFVLLDGGEVDVHVVHSPHGKYLRTDPDQTEVDNLRNLPDCHEREHVAVC